MKKQLISYMLLLLIITGSITLNSCEKPALEEEPRILQDEKDEMMALKLKDGDDIASTCWNIYCYARQTYFWNKELPKLVEYDEYRFKAALDDIGNNPQK